MGNKNAQKKQEGKIQEQPKAPAQKGEEEKKVEQTQNPTIKVPAELKEALEGLKVGEESVADVIRRLMIQKAATDIPDDGLIPLKMTGKSYRTLIMALGSTPALCDILWKARVPE